MSIIYFSNKIYRCLILEKKTHSALKVKWSVPNSVNQYEYRCIQWRFPGIKPTEQLNAFPGGGSRGCLKGVVRL